MDAVQVLGGRYRLVERLGTGGMSVVWRAYDEVLNRQVAVKVLAAKLTADRDSRDMIRAEAQAAARLSHPHVTGVYDYGESTIAEGVTVPYVVMELISGRTLAERLSRGPLPWRAALRVGAEVAAALAAAHARGLVHRDVKPANVMLTPSGAKVVDFGIAAVAGEYGEPGPDGMLLGTPAYLAPERLAGGPVRPATDVYALGLLLYRALTGGLPWEAETTTQMITAHVYAEPAPLPAVDGLPDGVAELCLRCLAKNPADRPTSREVARNLAAAVGIRVPLPADDRDSDDLVFDPTPFASRPLAGRPAGRLRLAVAALRGPVVDANADTAILPDAVIGGAAVRNARRLRRRRTVRLGGSAAGLALLISALATCADWPVGRNAPLNVAIGEGGVKRAVCGVRYVTRSDNTREFGVDVTVTNTGVQTLNGWTLTFTFTGDQTLRAFSDGQWTQDATSGQVTVRIPGGGASLAPGDSAKVNFTAAYQQANPLPTEFLLNGSPCSYVLVGAHGETQTGGPVPGHTPDTGEVADRLPRNGTSRAPGVPMSGPVPGVGPTGGGSDTPVVGLGGAPGGQPTPGTGRTPTPTPTVTADPAVTTPPPPPTPSPSDSETPSPT